MLLYSIYVNGGKRYRLMGT